MHRHDSRNQKVAELKRNLRVQKRSTGMKTGEEKLSGHEDNKPLMAVRKDLEGDRSGDDNLKRFV